MSPGRDGAGRGQEQRRGQPRTLRSRTRQGASFPGPPAAPGGPGALTHARTGPSRAGHPVACSACPVNQSAGFTGQKRAERSEGSRERGSRGHWRHGLSGAPAAVAPPADASGDEQQSRAHRGGRGAGRHAAAHTGARASPPRGAPRASGRGRGAPASISPAPLATGGARGTERSWQDVWWPERRDPGAGCGPALGDTQLAGAPAWPRPRLRALGTGRGYVSGRR